MIFLLKYIFLPISAHSEAKWPEIDVDLQASLWRQEAPAKKLHFRRNFGAAECEMRVTLVRSGGET